MVLREPQIFGLFNGTPWALFTKTTLITLCQDGKQETIFFGLTLNSTSCEENFLVF